MLAILFAATQIKNTMVAKYLRFTRNALKILQKCARFLITCRFICDSIELFRFLQPMVAKTDVDLGPLDLHPTGMDHVNPTKRVLRESGRSSPVGDVSRRAVFKVGLATATVSLAEAALPASAHLVRRDRFGDAHGSYRFNVGDYPCLIVSDGQLDFPAQWYASNATPSEYEPLLQAANLPTDMVSNQTSGLLVDTGKTLVLAETGITPRWRSLTGAPAGSLDRTGRILGNLKAAGVDRRDVGAVFISHGHPDHLGALIDDNDRSLFPNARIFYDRPDYNYHGGTDSTSTAEHRAETEVARRILIKVKSQLELIGPSTEIAPGITTVDLAGHTPGHCGLMIQSGGESLFHGADLVAHYVLSLARPDWSFYATHDKPSEIAARKTWFARAADAKMRVFFCHVPFPNLGHVVRAGDGFAWQPEYFRWAA